MKKQLLTLILTISMIATFCACGNTVKTPSQTPTSIEKFETENKEAITAAVSAMDGQTLALQEEMSWGMAYDDVKKYVEEPYIYDNGEYLASAFYSKLPCNEKWKDKDGNLVPEEFLPTDILAYYSVDAYAGLYEYGYMAPNTDLHEYDFLKEYYTNKYGEPAEETWEWNDPNYKPTGKEDYYQMFADGLVKVVTVWDIKELDTVLVIDWLNDPQKYNNNFGQISFYDRSDDFDVNAVQDLQDEIVQ